MGNGASELDASSPLGKVSERLQRGDVTLTKVDFTGYGIGDAGVERLAPLLFSASVKAVLLQSNNVSSAGADALARALVAAPSAASLAQLHLGRNGVTDAGAIALADALAKPPPPVPTRGLAPESALVRLDLGRNQLADGGATRLARAVAASGTLRVLALAFNEIADAGARALARALGGVMGAGAALQSLDLAHNRIGDDGAACLVGALARNVSLATLTVKGNHRMTASAALAAERAVARRPPERRRRAWWCTIIARLRFREERAAAAAAAEAAATDGAVPQVALCAPLWALCDKWEDRELVGLLKRVATLHAPLLVRVVDYMGEPDTGRRRASSGSRREV